MKQIEHPLDSSLIFPYVNAELSSPENMMKNLMDEYLSGGQEYNPETATLVRLYEKSYQTDSISSHFTEDIRSKCYQNSKPRYIDVWKSMSPEKIKNCNSTDEIRMMLSKEGGAECAPFSPALCLRMYIDFNPSRHPAKIIDPSAGWGDRLIASIVAGDAVESYTGYDPNPNLEMPFYKMIGRLDVNNKCSFYNEPFETAEVKIGYYDLGVTSPPYFDLEIYEDETKKTNQSICGNKNFQQWVENFYYYYLLNLKKSIRSGGRIIIYISAYRDRTGKFVDLENVTVNILTKRISGVKVFKKGYLQTNKAGKGFPRPFYVFDVM